MVNRFVAYFKNYLDYLMGVVLSAEGDITKVSYYFDDYQVPFGQQKAFIEDLERAGVLEINKEIPLKSLVLVNNKLGNGHYTAVGCLGYEMKVSKASLTEFMDGHPLIRKNKDETDIDTPYLIKNGEVLIVGQDSMKVRRTKGGKPTNNYVLAHAIFSDKNDDKSCTVSAFLRKAYPDKEECDMTESEINSIVRNAITAFNKASGYSQLIGRNDNNIAFSWPGSPNHTKFANLK
jgi:hypothetical protein